MNYLVATESFEDAKLNAKQMPEFQSKRMHIDGLQELVAVNGHRLVLSEVSSLKSQTVFLNNKHRDLAPKPPGSSVNC